MRAILMGLVLMGTALTGIAAAQDAPVPRLAPRVTSAEAFATPYGSALIDRFAANLAASVDAACLAERNVAAPSRERAADWLIRYGERALALDEARLDARSRAALPAFMAAAGAGAPQEFETLLRRPLIRELATILELEQPDNVAQAIAEALDDHLFRAAAPLARRLSPQAADGAELVAMLEERKAAARQTLERFVIEHSAVPEVERFIALVTAWLEATLTVAYPEPVAHRGFEGIVAELRASCIRVP